MADSKFAHLRNYFLTGLLVATPIALTAFLVVWLVNFVDGLVKPMFVNILRYFFPSLHISDYFVAVPGVGLVVVFVLLAIVGYVASGLFGRFLLSLGEKIVNRLPLIRNIYNAFKQITHTVASQNSDAFRQVVIFEYPRPGTWAMGFITGVTKGEVQRTTDDEVVNVFLPTTPNPTSGYLLFVPRSDLIILSMSVEEGIKMVISGGIVTPEYKPKTEKKLEEPSNETIIEK